MSLKFRKSIKLFPGAKINIGKTGIGVSTGIKGAHIGINKRGVYTGLGIPGTGISTQQYIGKGEKPIVLPATPKNNHLFLKILFFPIWFGFLITLYIFKIIIIMMVWLLNILTKRKANSQTDQREQTNDKVLTQ
ncbi:MAG TPA: DUF4236 domain-containing protein [Nitrososphaeraceae archaeon]|nr:DUF4236 domain-containing protein [Nitrososphaeraceae archaeon]